jgi:hypothetical protein
MSCRVSAPPDNHAIASARALPRWQFSSDFELAIFLAGRIPLQSRHWLDNLVEAERR